MGPSGSGKTSLLNALAGQVGVQKNLDLAGEVLVNGQPMEHSQHRQGYVQQEDMFFSQLTVRSECARACFVLHVARMLAQNARQLVACVRWSTTAFNLHTVHQPYLCNTRILAQSFNSLPVL